MLKNIHIQQLFSYPKYVINPSQLYFNRSRQKENTSKTQADFFPSKKKSRLVNDSFPSALSPCGDVVMRVKNPDSCDDTPLSAAR